MLEVINLLQTTYLDPGTVSVRVAFVLRSTEVIPVFFDLFHGLAAVDSAGFKVDQAASFPSPGS